MAEATEFLRMIAGDNGYVHIRMQNEESKKIEERWFRVKDSNDLDSTLRVKSEQGWHVWAQVSQVDKDSKEPKGNRFIWADLDDKNYPGGRTQALENIARLGFEPSLMVDSGGGLHLYWNLEQPVSPHHARVLAQAIQWQLGSDAVHNPNRMMRVPGTMNPKKGYDQPREARVISNSGRIYPILEVPRDIVLEGIGHKLVKQIVNGPDNVAEDRSAYDFKIVSHLMDLNLVDDQIKKLFEIYRMSGKYHSEGQNKHHYLQKTLHSARMRSQVSTNPANSSREPADWRVLSYQEILEEREAQFIVQDLLPVGGTAMLAAPPKARKSWMAMQLAYAVATGGDFLGFAVETPRKVVYVQAELPNWIVASRFRQMYGEAETLDNLKFVTVPAADLLTQADIDGLIEMVESTGAELIIIDPIANFWSGDENRASAVSGLFDNLSRLKPLNCAAVIVHHTKKLQAGDSVNANAMRGSNVFFARPDAVISLTPHPDYTMVGFDLRAAAPRDPLMLRVDTTGKFIPATQGAKPVVNADLQKKLIEIHRRAAELRAERLKQKETQNGPSEGKPEQEDTRTFGFDRAYPEFKQAEILINTRQGFTNEIGSGQEVHHLGNAQDPSLSELPGDFDPNNRTRN